MGRLYSLLLHSTQKPNSTNTDTVFTMLSITYFQATCINEQLARMTILRLSYLAQPLFKLILSISIKLATGIYLIAAFISLATQLTLLIGFFYKYCHFNQLGY
jgi:hypothetical protein